MSSSSCVAWISVVLLSCLVLFGDLVFAADASHVVQVIDKATGEPIAGAAITAEIGTRSAVRRPRVLEHYETDADGRATILGSPGRITVHAAGYFAEAIRGVPNRVALTAGHELTGRVVDATGEPLPSASVSLLEGVTIIDRAPGPSDRYQPSRVHETGVDAEGRFSVTVGKGTFAVEASAPNYSPRISATYEIDDLLPTELTLTLSPAETRGGVVTDDQGNVVEGAQVHLSWQLPIDHPDGRFSAYATPTTVVSDADGGLTIAAPSEATPQVHSVVHDGYRGRFNVVSEDPLRIELLAGQQVIGRFAALPDGVRTGTLVRKHAKYDWFDEVSPLEIRDDGHFLSGGFLPSRDEAPLASGYVHVPGYALAEVAWNGEGYGVKDAGLVTLERERSVRVHVRDLDGASVAGVTVAVHRIRGKVGRGWSYDERRTGSDGRAELTGFDDDEVWIHATHPDFKEQWVRTGEFTQPVEVTLESLPEEVQGRVFGQVLDATGQPLRFANVNLGAKDRVHVRGWVRYRRLLTDANGRFSEEVALPQRVKITVHAPGHELTSKLWNPEEGELEHDFGTIQLEAKARIRGRVVDANGAPVDRARVTFETWVETEEGRGRSRRRVIALSDAHGRFRVEATVGEQKITAKAAGLPVPPPLTVDATAGENADIEIVLPGVRTESKPYRGTVVGDHDPDRPFVGDPKRKAGFRSLPVGNGVPSAKITLAVERGESTTTLTATTDVEGHFQFDAIPPGRITAKIYVDNYLPFVQTFEGVDALPEKWPLDRGGVLEVTVLPAPHDVPRSPRVRLQQPSSGPFLKLPRRGFGEYTTEGGVLRFGGLKTGRYRFRLTAEDHVPSLTHQVSVVAGEIAELAIELRLYPTKHTFVVTGPDDEPVEGAQIGIGGSDYRHGSAVTDADGRAIVRTVFGYHDSAYISAPRGYRSVDLPIGEYVDQLEPIPVKLDAGGDLRVIVLDEDGEPTPDVVVQVVGARRGTRHAYSLGSGRLRRPTGDDGSVVFPSILAGERTLRFSERGEESRWQGVRAGAFLGTATVIVAAAEETVFTYRISEWREIAGRVLENDRPVTVGEVATRFGKIALDEEGRFTARVRGHDLTTFTWSTGGRLPVSREFDLAESAAVEIAFRSFDLRGRLLRPDGTPLAEFDGRLRRGGHRRAFTTDEDGRFHLESLISAPWSFELATFPPGTLLLAPEIHLDRDLDLEWTLTPTSERAIAVPRAITGDDDDGWAQPYFVPLDADGAASPDICVALPHGEKSGYRFPNVAGTVVVTYSTLMRVMDVFVGHATFDPTRDSDTPLEPEFVRAGRIGFAQSRELVPPNWDRTGWTVRYVPEGESSLPAAFLRMGGGGGTLPFGVYRTKFTAPEGVDASEVPASRVVRVSEEGTTIDASDSRP